MPTVTEHSPRRPEGRTGERGRYAHLFSEYSVDEQRVMDFWNMQGCSVSRIDEEDKRNPDFLIYFADGSTAICEVKSFGGFETGDSDYNLPFQPLHRISNALYTGARQLAEYPHAPEAFRILFFVNHNETLRFESLVKLLDGEWDPLRNKFLDEPNESSLDARRRRRKVDLYLWLRDTANSSANFPSQHWGNPDRIDEICTAMKLNPGRINLIQAA